MFGWKRVCDKFDAILASLRVLDSVAHRSHLHISELWTQRNQYKEGCLLLAARLDEMDHKLLLIHHWTRPQLSTLRLRYRPPLYLLGDTDMSVTMTRGQHTTATVHGFDQLGRPFPIDPSQIAWSFSDPTLISEQLNPDGSETIAALNAGSETVTAAVGAVTTTDSIVITEPTPALTTLAIEFTAPQ